MQRSHSKIFSSITAAAVAALALSGCAAESGTSAPAPDSQTADASEEQEITPADTEGTGEAILSFGDMTYTSELQFCSLTESEDALFHGLAYDDSGTEVGYLDGDFGILDGAAFGEARIYFGATKQLQSTDEFIAIGDAASHIVVTQFSDTSWYVMGGGWDQDGTAQSGVTLKVAC